MWETIFILSMMALITLSSYFRKRVREGDFVRDNKYNKWKYCGKIKPNKRRFLSNGIYIDIPEKSLRKSFPYNKF